MNFEILEIGIDALETDFKALKMTFGVGHGRWDLRHLQPDSCVSLAMIYIYFFL